MRSDFSNLSTDAATRRARPSGPGRRAPGLMTTGLLTAALLAGFAASASAQNAAQILERMQSEYESRVENIDNYSMTMSFMGFETTSYFVKEIVDGRPTFRMEQTTMAGMDTGSEADAGFYDDLYQVTDDLKDRARYIGRESIEGTGVHVIEVTDLEGTEFGQELGADGEFRPTVGRLYIDTNTYMPIRMAFEGELTNEDGVHTVTSTVNMRDIREHGGMLFAHSIQISITGLGEAMDEDMRAQFEEMERELANMPPEQRRMVETMMADQLEQFRSMMEGDAMTMDMQITEIRVNQGPPGR